VHPTGAEHAVFLIASSCSYVQESEIGHLELHKEDEQLEFNVLQTFCIHCCWQKQPVGAIVLFSLHLDLNLIFPE
jgi:hypothetical protein